METLERGLQYESTAAKANGTLEQLQLYIRTNNWGSVTDILVSQYPALEREIYQAQHTQIVQDLLETVPAHGISSYATDLRTGIEGLQKNSPLPYTARVREEHLGKVLEKVIARIEQTSTSVEARETTIADKLSKLPLASLPKELQQIRMRKGSSRELLDTAYKLQRRGAFNPKTFPDTQLDQVIAETLTDATMLKMLNEARNSTLETLTTLDALQLQKQELMTQLRQISSPAEAADIRSQLDAIDAKWIRESTRLQDTLQRCQNTKPLGALSENLQPHARKIIYIQYRLGIVLREDQLKALDQLVSNRSLLMQMRMGLGKTSILVPFALEILASEGYNAIGMVPKTQFHSNFDEMDEVTQLVFELAGNQLLFSRQDAPQPITTNSLHIIAQKCEGILKALEAGEYVLTTIESKASLDDKITEVEMAHAKLYGQWKKISDPDQAEAAYLQLMQHQAALDMLYRLKATFEHPNSRLIIDEADSVGRATYSVNSETGKKAMPDAVVRDTVTQLFEIIRTGTGEVESLRNEIFQNNQITLNEDEAITALKKDKMNIALKAVGKEWLQKHAPLLLQAEEPVLDWLIGGPNPFTAEDKTALPPTLYSQLKTLRKGINSGLRGSLSLKIGLSTDYDPIRQAIGVPAQQGLTSATTKYSDPLMQLCLANMIAMYKPQSEPYLLSAAGEVCDRLTARAEQEHGVTEEAANNLKELLARRKDDPTMNLAQEFTGTEPWKVLLRTEFADQTAWQQLIYVSDNQISRPVQHTLRGCNVIGLTGTATRNLTKVIESNGNTHGMDQVNETGRSTTAEVLYRLAKSSPQGLKTPVNSYSLQNNEARQQLINFAKKGSGYNFVVNQAAVCDNLSQRDIVEELHTSGRPIIFLDLVTNKKSALIHGKTVPLNQLSPEEKQQVRKEGFYYYPAPHTRGTHFDIPTGSKGALLLSPTVNADDRDQAAYRARELGEGHTVECFISEKQKQQIEESTGQTATLKDVLNTHFEQTKKDEGIEDLAAYRLHLQGIITLAADKAKMKLQLQSDVTHIGDYTKGEGREKFSTTSEQKAKLFDIFERFFVENTGNDAYLAKLDREMNQGGDEPTKDNLLRAIKGQRNTLQKLAESLENAKDELGDSYQIAINELSQAKDKLAIERDLIKKRWDTVAGQFPAVSPAVSNTQATAEVEAEQEAQQEQQIEVESVQDTQRKARASATQDLLTKVPTVQEIKDAPARWGMIVDFAVQSHGIKKVLNAEPGVEVNPEKEINYLSHHHAVGSGLTIAETVAVTESMKYAVGGGLPDVQFLVVDKAQDDGTIQRRLILASSSEGHMASGNYGGFFGVTVKDGKENAVLFNGAIIRPRLSETGTLQLVHQKAATGAKGLRDELEDENAPLQAQLLIGLLHLGVNQISEEQWMTIKKHFDSLSQTEQEDLQTSLTDRLAASNPKYLNNVASHLWAAPMMVAPPPRKKLADQE